MANLFSVNNGKLSYNKITTNDFNKKHKNIKTLKQTYDIEKKVRNNLKNDLNNYFGKNGVIANSDNFGNVTRAIMPIQNQNKYIQKGFSIQQDGLTENIKNEKNFQDLKQSDTYEQKKNDLISQSNIVGYAKYDLDKSIVEKDKIGWYDKSIGRMTEGAKSIFDISGGMIQNENGDYVYLPNKTELKSQKVNDSYDTNIGKFLGNAAYEVGRIGGTTLINGVVPYAGSTAYFGRMFMDSTNSAMRDGYKQDNAIAYGLTSTTLEFLTGKLLGSATKGLTGGSSSQLSNAIANGVNKFINKPGISNFIGNASSEATEEFLQEYLDNINRLIILDGNTNINDYIDIFKDEDILKDAIYSAGIGAVSGGILGSIGNNEVKNIKQNKNLLNTFKIQLEETKSTLNNKKQINKYNKIIKDIDNYIAKPFGNENQLNKILPTVEDIVQRENNNENKIKRDGRGRLQLSTRSNSNETNSATASDTFQLRMPQSKTSETNSGTSSFSETNISQNNINVNSSFDIEIENALTNKNSKGNIYLGKQTNNKIINLIKKITGIDIKNRNQVLSKDYVRHLYKHSKESNSNQIPITIEDIKKIPNILSQPDKIIRGSDTLDSSRKKLIPSIRYIKTDNTGKIYVIEAIPDKGNLQIKTMWKEPTKLIHNTDNNQILHHTSETANSESSTTLIAPNIPQVDKNVNSDISSNINMPVVEKNTNKVMNPNEISRLKQKDANTTPNLPNAKVSAGKGESSFYENVTKKTKMLPDNVRGMLATESDIQYYKEVTNEASLNKAYERLNSDGASETLRWFNQDSSKATDIDVAEGWILLKQYSDNKQYDEVVQVAKKMREIGTKAGQTVQAFNIMSRLTPEGMVKYAQSELSEAYDNMVKNKSREWIEKYREDFDLKPEETAFIMDTMQEVQQMEDGYDKRVKLAEIQKLMTDKLPPVKGAGIKAWMRISMLFNPKTQVRNVMGNAVIAPVNYFSDMVSSAVDKSIAKKTGVRTTGITNLKEYGKGFKTGLYQSYNDFKKGINTRNIQGNRFEIGEGKSFNENHTGMLSKERNAISKALNNTDKMLSFVLDAGDRGFYEASFTNSINNQLVLNNTTEVTQEMIDIATQEALSRTWQDNNNYTRFVLNIRKGLNAIHIPGQNGYGLGDVLIPFAKTPANLTKAIIDYSPAGLINTITQGINLNRSLTNGQYTAQMQHQFVQSLGKATAGSMLYVIGLALASAGITSGESDEDKDVSNFMKNTLGITSYSIKIGDKTFTYDWAQPVAAPLAITSNIIQKQKEGAKLMDNIITSIDTGLNVLFEQSFLESINNVLSDSGAIGEKLIEQVLDLPARAVPTFLKQIADLVDGTQRQTFEKDKPLETAKNKVKAKIPFVSKNLAPSVDSLGREIQKYGGNNNPFNVFLNPANVNTENISTSAKEIYRLYKSTGETNIMPRVAPYSITYKNEKLLLNSKQREDYQKISGKIIDKSIKKLLNSKEYKNLTDKDKAIVVESIVGYSYNIAQNEILDIEISKNYKKAYEYSEIGNISDYYTFKASIDDTNKDTKRSSITNYLTNSNLNNKQLAFLYGNYYSSEETLNMLLDADVSIKEFIKYNSQEFTTDYYNNGKAVPNSRLKKVINYVNSLNLSVPQKALLIKMEYSSYDKYDKQIAQYVNSKNIDFLDKAMILKKVGFTAYDKQIINYVNKMSKTKSEKEEILEELGFTIRNGRVYS